MPLEQEIIKDLILSAHNETISSIAEVLRFHMQYEDIQKIIISNINNLLNASKTRVNGLKLLGKILAYCPPTVLVDNANIWMNYCLNQQSARDSMKEIKLETLANIIEVTTSIASLSKKVVSENLSAILKSCLDITSCEDEASLKCLSQCMQLFPAWFGNHHTKLQPFLENFLDSSSQSTVEGAAVAFLYFQQTGSAGVESINYTDNFRKQFTKLCATIHLLYDDFLEGVSEVDQVEGIESETFTFPPVPSQMDSCEVLGLISRRIISCLIFLKTMIVKKFRAVKQFVPKYIVDVITRGLSLHICLSDEQVSKHTNTLSLELNEIQMQLLNLLHPLFVGHFMSMLPFSHVLTKTLINTVKMSDNCRCFASNRLYSQTCYKTLNMWLSLSKSCDPTLVSILIPVLIQEIIPKKKNIRLTCKSTGKNKSRKRSHDAEQIKETDTNYSCSRADYVKERNCLQASQTIKTLLENAVIDCTKCEELVIFVVKTLMDINRHREISPYTNIDCQVALYEVLIAFLTQTNFAILPSLNYIVEILNAGLSRPSRAIVSVCVKGLDLVEKISQPVCPTLQSFTNRSQYQTENSNQSANIFEMNKRPTPDVEEDVEHVKIVASKELSILSDPAVATSPDVNNSDFENDTNRNVADAILNDSNKTEVVSSITEENAVMDTISGCTVVKSVPVSYVMEEVHENIKSNGYNQQRNIYVEEAPSEKVLSEDDKEPSVKKNKIEDLEVEDMFSSFKNVVQ